MHFFVYMHMSVHNIYLSYMCCPCCATNLVFCGPSFHPHLVPESPVIYSGTPIILGMTLMTSKSIILPILPSPEIKF
jgi:hypothetical protein